MKFLKEFCLFLIGLIIFISVFYFIGLENIVYQLSKLNLFYYSLAVICIFLTILSWAFKWDVFIKNGGYKVHLLSLLGNLSVGIAINNLTPVAKFGGEPVRIYLLKEKDDIPTRVGSATVLAELTIEFILSVLFVIISILLIALLGNTPLWLSLILVIFLALSIVGFVGIFGIYSRRKFISKMILWFTNKIKRVTPFREKILTWYREFQKAFRKGFKDKRSFFIALLFGILMKVFDIMKFIFIFMALGYPISIIQIFIALGVSVMLLSIPATPGSLGIWEGGMISALIFIGIPLEIAATAVFLERLVWFWGITIFGGVMGVYYGTDVSKSHYLKDIKTCP